MPSSPFREVWLKLCTPMNDMKLIQPGQQLRPKFLSPRALGVLITLALFAFLLFYAVIASFSFFRSFDEIARWNTSHLPEFHNPTPEDFLFTTGRYQLSKIICVLLWLIVIAVPFLVLRYKNHYQRLCTTLGTPLRKSFDAFAVRWKNTPLPWKIALWVLLVISLVLRFIQYDHMLIHNDEIATYNYFVRQGLIYTSVQYFMPNNHVFFNHLFFFMARFIHDPLLAGRMVSFLSFTILLIVTFFGLQRFTGNYLSAFLAVSVICFLFPGSAYAVIGRGYMLSTLFLLLAFIFLQKAARSREKGFYIWFSFFSILGAFTIPIFFIPIISSFLFLLLEVVRNHDRHQLKWMILSGCLVGSGILFCYLPILLYSGPEALLFNKFVAQGFSWNDYLHFFPIQLAEILSFLSTTTTRGWLVFLVFLLGGIICYRKVLPGERDLIRYAFLILSVIILYAFLTKTYYPLRSLTMYSVIIYPAMAIVTTHFLLAVSGILRYTGIAMVMILLPYRGFVQYRFDPFSFILPTDDQRELDRLFLENKDLRIYLDYSDKAEFIYEYCHYLQEYRDLHLVDDPEKATLIIQDFDDGEHPVRPDSSILMKDLNIILYPAGEWNFENSLSPVYKNNK